MQARRNERGNYDGICIGGPEDGKFYECSAPRFRVELIDPSRLFAFDKDGGDHPLQSDTFEYVAVAISIDQGAASCAAWVPAKDDADTILARLIRGYAEWTSKKKS